MMLRHQGNNIKLFWESFQRQQGATDCGLFAIAAATALCCGLDPSTCQWDQEQMRNHLEICFLRGSMLPFPAQQRRRKGLKTMTNRVHKYAIYCHCRMPYWPGDCNMAMCSMCLKWFHAECENIASEVFVDKSTIYVCAQCQMTLN